MVLDGRRRRNGIPMGNRNIMVERVQTGGVMSFDYSSQKRGKLSDEKKRDIKEAYGKYHERKRKERRNKIIGWGIVIFLILAVLAFILISR